MVVLNPVRRFKGTQEILRTYKGSSMIWQKPVIEPPSGISFGAAGPAALGIDNGPLVIEPPSVIAGQLLLLAISVHGHVGFQNIPGWTYIATGPSGGNAITSRTHVYSRVAESENNGATFLISTATATIGQIYSIQGAVAANLLGITTQGAATLFTIPGGTVQPSSLVMAVVSTRSGNIASKPAIENTYVSDFLEVGSDRLATGGGTSLTTFVGNLSAEQTEIGPSQVTLGSAARFSGVQLNIIGA